ncbi:uncharacterized protein LOC132946085 [Metopolophium dirhodum]|uniref:uncharacterized protein LOC132946085 n=1 Tax=Metopolophium dirhodum TaxID=44670 RepID=UPI00298FD0F0|nr:uncharacterized protein LOC132946085 [Metopolophium dirhodum]
MDQNKEADEQMTTSVEAHADLIQEVDHIAFPSDPCKKVVDDEQYMYKITEGQHPTSNRNLVSVNYIINDIDQNKEYAEEMATLVDVDLIPEVDHTANFKINKYLDNQTTNLSSHFQFPNLQRKKNFMASMIKLNIITHQVVLMNKIPVLNINIIMILCQSVAHYYMKWTAMSLTSKNNNFQVHLMAQLF